MTPTTTACKTTGCFYATNMGDAYCSQCKRDLKVIVGEAKRVGDSPMSEKYPKYYKKIPKGMTEIDVYGVCKLFPVADDTGCIRHATKKLLVPGTRTGGKSFRDDIKEARDTLTRWLELNPE
jgi:hypothetical protein